MEFTYNRKSKGTLEELQHSFEEDRSREKSEYLQKYGFKSFDELKNYLISGGVSGEFNGGFGEYEGTNDFLYYNGEVFVRHSQQMGPNDCSWWMKTDMLSEEKLKEWADRCNDNLKEDGYYPIYVFKKNPNVKREDAEKIVSKYI